MARPESRQVAGYFPTPTHLLSSFASILRWPEGVQGAILDPCAGDGEAVVALRQAWQSEPSWRQPYLVACELEAGRARQLRDRLRDLDRGYRSDSHHGDAFHLHWTAADDHGAAVLFLNPPYDMDPEFGRLEHRFLSRFTEALYPGHGVLLYLVPVHALEASADFLAGHYQDLRCWRLPEGDFQVYSQVLVQGRRARRPRLSEHTAARIRAWVRQPERLPVLPEVCPEPLELTAPGASRMEFSVALGSMDLRQALAAFRPWEGVPVGMNLPLHQLLGTRYAAALPPKPTHVALAMASGVFNGLELDPNPADSLRLPSLIAKGAFHRKLHHVSDRTNQEGEVTGSVQVELPELVITIQRLDTLECHTLLPGSTPTGGEDLCRWTAADLIQHYSLSLGRLLERQFPPRHRPGREQHRVRLPTLARTPFPVQDETIQAALKILAQGRNPFLLAEVGVGKTTMALITLACLRAEHRPEIVRQLEAQGFEGARQLPTVRRALVVCPPHLVDTWEEEIDAVMPHARVRVVRGIGDLSSLDEETADLYLLSREKAKLGHAFEGLTRCPRCGRPSEHSARSNATHRRRCPARLSRPTNAAARLLEEMATQLVPYDHSEHVLNNASRRMLSHFREEDPIPCPLHRLENLVKRTFAVLAQEARADRLDSTEALGSALDSFALAARQLPLAARLLEILLQERTLPARITAYLRKLHELLALESRYLPPAEQSRRRGLLDLADAATWTEPRTCGEPLFAARPRPRRVSLAR